jgi:hypothetical protein
MSKDATKEKGAAQKAEPKTTGISEDATIKLLVKDNPKKAGSKARTRFALYTNGQKVSAFLAAGGTRADIAWDIKHGYIEVTDKAA